MSISFTATKNHKWNWTRPLEVFFVCDIRVWQNRAWLHDFFKQRCSGMTASDSGVTTRFIRCDIYRFIFPQGGTLSTGRSFCLSVTITFFMHRKFCCQMVQKNARRNSAEDLLQAWKLTELKYCTENYEIFVKVTAKKSVSPFFLDTVYIVFVNHNFCDR